ncbi:MAG: enoyl-ACP reductase FabI [Thermoleophilaceae bacterium]|nr:enoyl-ACP reductase FabI [Thermoleophilaceae bacterium]
MSLEGKRILVTGVITRRSIAFSVAEQAQLAGAEVLLTGFGRGRRMTERAAARLPDPPDVLELDVNKPEDLEALTGELDSRWGGVDGALHAIAFAPEDALGGNFLGAPASSASAAFETSAYSFKSLAAALHPLMGGGGGLVALDFDASVAWPAYDWMGVSKAALEAVGRYLARDLGPSGVRVNLVSAGPLDTPAAGGIPGFEDLAAAWQKQAPLGWDVGDPKPVADAVCFLLSDLARGITGEIIHVDGGFHAIGAAVESVEAGESVDGEALQDESADGRSEEGESAEEESAADGGSAEDGEPKNAGAQQGEKAL